VNYPALLESFIQCMGIKKKCRSVNAITMLACHATTVSLGQMRRAENMEALKSSVIVYLIINGSDLQYVSITLTDEPPCKSYLYLQLVPLNWPPQTKAPCISKEIFVGWKPHICNLLVTPANYQGKLIHICLNPRPINSEIQQKFLQGIFESSCLSCDGT
jgi:hypothetical protein